MSTCQDHCEVPLLSHKDGRLERWTVTSAEGDVGRLLWGCRVVVPQSHMQSYRVTRQFFSEVYAPEN